MAKKRLGNVSKLLGGLGAMYAFSKLPVGKGVKPEDVENSPERQRMAADFAALSRRPLYEPSDAEQAERAREDARRRARLPVLTSEQEAAHLREFPEIARSGAGLTIRTSDGFLTTQQFKKGGKVSSGSKTASASRRGDGIAQRGKTRGRMV